MKTKIVGYLFLIIVFSINGLGAKDSGLILVIGDGMGTNQVALLEEFLESSKHAKENKIRNAFKRLKQHKAIDNRFFGLSRTGTRTNIGVDSACSATQLAVGRPSLPEVLGLDENGNPVDSILMKAQRAGYKTGLITDTRLTHATPAAFVAHLPFRWMEDEIAEAIINTTPDLVMGGGMNRFVPASFQNKDIKGVSVSSKRADQKNLLSEATRKGYKLLTKKDHLKAKHQASKKILGLFSNHNYPDAYSLEAGNEELKEVPSLADMAGFGLDFLNKKSKKQKSGFFLMIEGGQIDWSGHKNDVGGVLREMLRFNEMLNRVIDFLDSNPQHTLVVTADHETGGFSMGYNYLDMPEPKNIKGKYFSKNKYQSQFNYVDVSRVEKIFNQPKSLHWVWEEYKTLKAKTGKDSPEALGKLIYEATKIKLNSQDLADVLKSRVNDHKHDWHMTLKVDKLPKINDMREYYYETNNARTALIGRKLAAKQNVMWATGGHSFSPVPVYSVGPGAKILRKLTPDNHVDLGKSMQEILGL